jgi:Domain of unknown function (DUF4249)
MPNLNPFAVLSGQKKAFTVALVALWALLAVHCAKEVIIELPEESKRLVIVSHFTENQPARVKISYSKPVHDAGEAEFPEKDLEVSLSSNGVFLDKMKKDKRDDLFWYSRDTLRAGVSYTIVARLAGVPVAEGTSSIPLPIESVPAVQPSEISLVGNVGERYTMRIPMTISIKDIPSKERFYAFRLTHEVDVFDTTTVPASFSHSFVDENTFFTADGRTVSLLHEIPEPAYIINENFWADGRSELLVTANITYTPGAEQPRRLFLEWRTLSREFYRYHLSLARQNNHNTPLAEPDAIFNNVKNGYGNVSGYASRIDTIEIPF